MLTSFITSAKFLRHEYTEYVLPVIQSEFEASAFSPEQQALEIAHSIAFRSGLGASLFANPHSVPSSEQVKEYAKSVFVKENIAVLGTGIPQDTLTKLVEKGLAGLTSGASTKTKTASKYYGGESRFAAHGPETLFIGYGTAGAPAPELAVLAAHLDPTPVVKWSAGASPVGPSLPAGVSAKAVYLPYSDAALVGVLVQADSPAKVAEAGKVVVAELKKAASSGLQGEQLKKAVAKAKMAAAGASESRTGFVDVFGPKVRLVHSAFDEG
jgi:ubiquinol-cytochrome c reductase core subunit 2